MSIQDSILQRADHLETLRKLRREASAEIDRLIAFLDETGGDPDLEPDADDEENGDLELCAGDEPELDLDTFEGSNDEDKEPQGDDEPAGYVLNRADMALRHKLRAARAKPAPIGSEVRFSNGTRVSITAHVD